MKIAGALRGALGAWLCCAALAAGAEPPAGDVTRRDQGRLTGTAAAWQKFMLSELTADALAHDIVAAVEFKLDPSEQPAVGAVRRFGGIRVSVSAGWLALSEDMIRASLIDERAGEPGCWPAYAEHLANVFRHNREVVARERGLIRTDGRLAVFARSAAGSGCRGRPPEDALADALDATLVWLIGREVAGLLRGVALQRRTLVVEPVADGNAGNCPQAAADHWSIERSFDMRVDPLAAQPAVFFHLLVVEPAAPAGCPQGFERLAVQFDHIDQRLDSAATHRIAGLPANALERHLALAALRERARRAWPAGSGGVPAGAAAGGCGDGQAVRPPCRNGR